MTKSYLKWLVLAMMFLPMPLAAQDYAIDRGSVTLGGSVSWSSAGGDLYENTEGDRYNSILLNPWMLYFITPGLAVGGDLYVESESQGDLDAQTIAAGPAVAYYFGGAESKVYPFISGNLGYGKITTSVWDGSGLIFGAGAGAAFMLSQSVALTAGGTYRIRDLTINQLDQSFGGNTFALRLGVQAFLF